MLLCFAEVLWQDVVRLAHGYRCFPDRVLRVSIERRNVTTSVGAEWYDITDTLFISSALAICSAPW